MQVLFLPGIVAPAAVRYAPLLAELGDIDACVKDLEVYATETPPPDHSIAMEVAAIERAANDAGFGRFHLCAHSGGGACALAFVAAHPERVVSLAVDEPATDFTEADRSDPYWLEIAAARALPNEQATPAFLRLQMKPGVDPPRWPGPPPPWMAKRPVAIRVFSSSLQRHAVEPDRYRAFDKPVLFTHGSLSHPRWLAMCERLAGLFPKFRSELFEGLSHLNTSHQAEPARTAALLREHWHDPMAVQS